MIEFGLIDYKKNTLISTLTPNTQQAYNVLNIDLTLIQRHGVESMLNLCWVNNVSLLGSDLYKNMEKDEMKNRF